MSTDPFEMLQKGNILLTKGNYKDALDLLSYAKRLASENKKQDALAAVYSTIGYIYSCLGSFENAKKHLELIPKPSIV